MAKTSADFYGPIIRGELQVIQELVQQGVSVNEPTGPGTDRRPMPLHYAIDRDQTEIAKFFIASGADINSNHDQFARTPLHLAADKGRVEILRELLKAGAKLDVVDRNGWSPLDTAAAHDGAKAGLMVAELIKKGCDVQRFSPTWGPPIIKSCWRGHLSGLKVLLQHGADPNVMTLNGTPLMQAASNKKADAVIILRLAGADPNLRYTWTEETKSNNDSINQTPLEYARKLKLKKIIPLLEATREELEVLAAPPPLTAADVPALWKRIAKWLGKAAAQTKKCLKKAAADDDVQALEQICGVSLPADFRASLAIHDGQKDGAEESLVPEDWCDEPYELLPIKNIIHEWKMWKDLVDGGEFRGQRSSPDDGVREDWWHPAWIPFAGNGGGDFLCIDLAPTEAGRSGQVIEMRHDSESRRKFAGSFAEFLRELAERWESKAAE